MTHPIGVKHITSDPEIFGGKPCIEGHRISVHDVASWHRQGIKPESIAEDFDLTQAEVYAALAYYYDHQEEIDRDLAAEEAEIARLARQDMRLRESYAGALAGVYGSTPQAIAGYLEGEREAWGE